MATDTQELLRASLTLQNEALQNTDARMRDIIESVTSPRNGTARVMPVSRRDFLKFTGMAGGGLMLALGFTPVDAPGAEPVGSGADSSVGGTPGPADFAPNAFLRIGSDDVITLIAKGPEIGQGIKTTFPMILAEELDADWGRIRIEQALIKQEIYGSQTAGGSRSVPNNWELLRRAGAVARTLLVQAAAGQWKVTPEECSTAKGVVRHDASGRSLRYGELAQRAAALPVPDPKDVTPKARNTYTLLGTRQGGVDNLKVVTGQPLFGIDQALPGMLYAVYEKSPAHGGTASDANLDEIKALPGVTDAFITPGDSRGDAPPGVVIVATSTWAAFRAKKKLKVNWSISAASLDSWRKFSVIARSLAGTRGPNVVTQSGDIDAALKGGVRSVEAFYDYAFVAHATLEPQNTTAWLRGDSIEIWTPTQIGDRARPAVAQMLGFGVDRVIMHQTRVGGGFGRRLAIDYVGEAVVVAQRVKGPVKLMWTREDDMGHDYYRVGGFHSLKGAVDAQGRLSAWQDHFISFTADGKRAVSGGDMPTDEFPAPMVPNVHVSQTLLPLGTRCGPWRAPRSNTVAWVIQSFLHELSVAGGRNHRDFLLELMGEPRWLPPQTDRALHTGRAAAVIKAVAEKAGWGRKLPKGRAQGLAFHFSHAGHFAEVAEISVSKQKQITIHRIVVVGDVGPILNRSMAEHQCVGAVTDALSTLMNLQVTIEDGVVTPGNFGDYPMLRMAKAPPVELHFIESEFPPTGLGEPALPPLAPALCNAIFAATGHRVRMLPLSREGYTL
ncbi:MAG: molybdopterin-dependent oxidoreductase [Steroidobacteraceae bacterium]